MNSNTKAVAVYDRDFSCWQLHELRHSNNNHRAHLIATAAYKAVPNESCSHLIFKQLHGSSKSIGHSYKRFVHSSVDYNRSRQAVACKLLKFKLGIFFDCDVLGKLRGLPTAWDRGHVQVTHGHIVDLARSLQPVYDVMTSLTLCLNALLLQVCSFAMTRAWRSAWTRYCFKFVALPWRELDALHERVIATSV